MSLKAINLQCYKWLPAMYPSDSRYVVAFDLPFRLKMSLAVFGYYSTISINYIKGIEDF